MTDDRHYKFIFNNRWEVFWKAHSQDKPGKEAFFSDSFKDLIEKTLVYEPEKRLTIAQIKAHPWFTGPMPTPEQVINDCTQRKAVTDDI